MGHLLKLNCAYSPLNIRILSLTSVPLTLTTVQVPNLELTHKKRITVYNPRSSDYGVHDPTGSLEGKSTLYSTYRINNTKSFNSPGISDHKSIDLTPR